jgi:hypothetical protein
VPQFCYLSVLMVQFVRCLRLIAGFEVQRRLLFLKLHDQGFEQSIVASSVPRSEPVRPDTSASLLSQCCGGNLFLRYSAALMSWQLVAVVSLYALIPSLYRTIVPVIETTQPCKGQDHDVLTVSLTGAASALLLLLALKVRTVDEGW